jgi:hypothetical protein
MQADNCICYYYEFRMDKSFKYNKKHKIWVRKIEKNFKYFNLSEWKYLDFTEDIKEEDFCSREDFSEK